VKYNSQGQRPWGTGRNDLFEPRRGDKQGTARRIEQITFRRETRLLPQAVPYRGFSQLDRSESTSKTDLYDQLAAHLSSLLAGERDLIANAANFAALIFHALPDLNWAGFYFLKDDELVLGPFQGRPACVRIGIGKGVCGTAASTRATTIVPNVHEFPGHIACDSASNSEIVVPLIKGDQLIGVLDLDSPIDGRFDNEDGNGLNRLVSTLVQSSELPQFV